MDGLSRFIPAGAGNTPGEYYLVTSITVHPCGRREHGYGGKKSGKKKGSSLRAQGTLLFPGNSSSCVRFIPAGAGNTAVQWSGRLQKPVHPCGRREHSNKARPVCSKVGSSLRAQGTHNTSSFVQLENRFIPAGAGNTQISARLLKYSSVHPCGRREHTVATNSPQPPRGSSLRAQGTHAFIYPDMFFSRFIPAGAGNTPDSWWQIHRLAVHPCGRREHSGGRDDLKRALGSSLRAQGTLCFCCHSSTLYRFIPAGAGNTSQWNHISTKKPVHPCGRREHACS